MRPTLEDEIPIASAISERLQWVALGGLSCTALARSPSAAFRAAGVAGLSVNRHASLPPDLRYRLQNQHPQPAPSNPSGKLLNRNIRGFTFGRRLPQCRGQSCMPIDNHTVVFAAQCKSYTSYEGTPGYTFSFHSPEHFDVRFTSRTILLGKVIRDRMTRVGND